jgi:predicted transposase/invertase (TIGR01784 family)
MQKGVRLDVVAKTEDGQIINVEVQKKDEKNMTGRSLFYWAQLFSRQLLTGGTFNELKRTIYWGPQRIRI